MDGTSERRGINPVFIITGVVIILLIGVGYVLATRNTAPTDNNITMTSEESMITPSPATDVTPTTSETSSDTSEVRTITVEAGSFYYKPDEIRVKKGEKVKIVMNSVSMMHDFVIDKLNVRIPVTQSGNTASVEFTADETGTFEYYCSVGNHRQQGQVGSLIVEE